MTEQPEKVPEFRPGNWEVLWYLRDNCSWPSGAKAVYKAMYERWGKRPLNPSDALLAQDIGTSVRFVIKWRKWLAARGLLTWYSGQEIGDSNIYTIYAPWSPATPDEMAERDSGRGMNEVHRGYERGAHQGMNEVHTSSEGVRTTFIAGTHDVQRGYARRADKDTNEDTKEDKREDNAAAVLKTSLLAGTNGVRDDLGGGSGGRSEAVDHLGIPLNPRVMPPLPEWDGIHECRAVLKCLLGELDITGRSGPPFCQQDEEGQPYAVMLQRHRPLADAQGVPLQEWLTQAAIYLCGGTGLVNPETISAALDRIAGGERLVSAEFDGWTLRQWLADHYGDVG